MNRLTWSLSFMLAACVAPTATDFQSKASDVGMSDDTELVIWLDSINTLAATGGLFAETTAAGQTSTSPTGPSDCGTTPGAPCLQQRGRTYVHYYGNAAPESNWFKRTITATVGELQSEDWNVAIERDRVWDVLGLTQRRLHCRLRADDVRYQLAHLPKGRLGFLGFVCDQVTPARAEGVVQHIAFRAVEKELFDRGDYLPTLPATRPAFEIAGDFTVVQGADVALLEQYLADAMAAGAGLDMPLSNGRLQLSPEQVECMSKLPSNGMGIAWFLPEPNIVYSTPPPPVRVIPHEFSTAVCNTAESIQDTHLLLPRDLWEMALASDRLQLTRVFDSESRRGQPAYRVSLPDVFDGYPLGRWYVGAALLPVGECLWASLKAGAGNVLPVDRAGTLVAVPVGRLADTCSLDSI